jgi:hypothetical protein
MQETLHNYFLKELARCQQLGMVPEAKAAFLAQARQALLEVAAHLDNLPGEDSFWSEVHGNFDYSVLRLFTRYLRHQRPCNTSALWCDIAQDYLGGSGYLSVEEWRQLHRCGELDVRHLVHSAWYIAASLSDFASYLSCLSRDLAHLLVELELGEAAKPILRALPSEVQPLGVVLVLPLSPEDWSLRVLRGLEYPRLWDGISRIDQIRNNFPDLFPLLPEYGRVSNEELIDAAVQLGYTTAASGAPPDTLNDSLFNHYYQENIRPTAEFVFEEERPMVLLFGSLVYGSLLRMRVEALIDERGFQIAEEYLTICLLGDAFYLSREVSSQSPPDESSTNQ